MKRLPGFTNRESFRGRPRGGEVGLSPAGLAIACRGKRVLSHPYLLRSSWSAPRSPHLGPIPAERAWQRGTLAVCRCPNGTASMTTSHN
jgi:hypothetical protein